MERNDEYWNGQAAFETCVIKTVTDTNTAVLSVESGDADVALNLPLDSLINIQNPDVKMDSQLSFEFGYFQWNFLPESSVANDKNFRKAVQYGINKDDINENECGSAVYAHHIRESPQIAESYGRACHGHKHTERALEMFSLHCQILFQPDRGQPSSGVVIVVCVCMS